MVIFGKKIRIELLQHACYACCQQWRQQQQQHTNTPTPQRKNKMCGAAAAQKLGVGLQTFIYPASQSVIPYRQPIWDYYFFIHQHRIHSRHFMHFLQLIFHILPLIPFCLHKNFFEISLYLHRKIVNFFINIFLTLYIIFYFASCAPVFFLLFVTFFLQQPTTQTTHHT